MSLRYKCAVNGCIDPISSQHRFPHPQKQAARFQEWMKIIAHLSLLNLNNIFIYNNYRVCLIHFRKEHVSINGRLYKCAIPALNLTSHTGWHMLKDQLKNRMKKPQARRFTLHDKIMGYKLLSRLFALPSRNTIMSVLKKIKFGCGINQVLFNHIKESIKNLQSQEKYCTLMFDEMALQANLHWSTSQDRIIGFEDYGFECSSKIADHALVFMLRLDLVL
ncbi:thap-type zinc finger [Holotrichia oblita]|uniref:Thap-type zinc finger n=2 Tax=Holotrichia oblita TaxID=644536 RepID=A0ACB9T3V6_HOLOL|nr:thap-type zinc finger [Holotrichia oblita]KAI4461504.1 thap-type zinc finger [Holotrichia oblita]